MEPSSLHIYCTKDWQKWTRGEKVTSPQSMGDQFYRNFFTKQLIAYFQTPQKIFKYYSVAFGITRWFVELKMTISEQFKLFNLNKKKRKLCTDEGGGVKMKKNEKKTTFCNLKNCIFFPALFWLLLWLCISKMICKAWKGASISL